MTIIPRLVIILLHSSTPLPLYPMVGDNLFYLNAPPYFHFVSMRGSGIVLAGWFFGEFLKLVGRHSYLNFNVHGILSVLGFSYINTHSIGSFQLYRAL